MSSDSHQGSFGHEDQSTNLYDGDATKQAATFPRERMLSYDFSKIKRPKLVIVTCILPLQFCPSSEEGQQSRYFCRLIVDELCLAVNSLRFDFLISWVGWPRARCPDTNGKMTIQTMLELAPIKMVPVFMSDEEIESHMSGFCRKVVWTNFHNMPHPSSPFVNKAQLLTAYDSVNRKFAQKALACKGDMYWIVGHELMLVPQMIREVDPNAKIGFFLHIPFPVEHHFFAMPNRRQLLEGMLGADLVGFQTYDFFRSFVSCIYKLTGKTCNLRRLEIGDRVVTVDEFPMGVDYEFFTTTAQEGDSVQRLTSLFEKSQSYWQTLSTHSIDVFDSITLPSKISSTVLPVPKFVEELENMKIKQGLIVTSDRLNRSDEIALRIEAYRLFLKKNPDYRTKVFLLLIVQPPLFPSETFNDVKNEIDQLVTNLNGSIGTISWKPIVYLYGSLSLPAMKRIFCRADVCLAVPLKAGMGLLAKEYVAARSQSGTGVLILSENTGAAKELTEALIVNPYDATSVADALLRAMQMSTEEQNARISSMQERLRRNDIYHWASSFLNSLNEAHQVSTKSRTQRLAAVTYIQVVTAYRQAQGRRLLIFDYDGTLAELSEVNPPPDSEILYILNGLCAEEKNTVVINSGRDKDTLESWFGDTKVDIAAMHGVWIKTGGEWRKMIDVADQWKTEVLSIVSALFENVQGVKISDSDYSVEIQIEANNQYTSDSIKEQLRSRSETLRCLIANAGLRIIESERRLEIKSAIISKGRAILNWFKADEPSTWDFILSIGDDFTDEDTFRELPESAITVKVGMTPTEAKYYLMNAFDVRMFLRDLMR